ncbi:hypothetical protein NST58_06815 [Paenibacillus sp. FSL R10-2796]|uniref:hypothetical protein n=1 Tax=Paenibacillus sp. FSL R10-2796 TaxID=2954663 RepID=UPI0030D766C4
MEYKENFIPVLDMMILIDRSLSENEMEKALAFVYDIHRKRPIKKSISIVKGISGRGVSKRGIDCEYEC